MSLSRHPEVVQVVEGKTFVEAVRLSCITLGGEGTLSDEVIRRTAYTQAYPRIALVLATTVDKDYNSILPPGSISYEILYREVERLATSQPYVDDIHRIAASLTASYFIRSVPLNSSIQFLPMADKMEERAIQDLDRLRGQVLHQISGLLGGGTSNSSLPGGPSFYFTGLVEDGRSTDRILIPEGTRGVAVYTLTPSYQPTPLEVAIGVPATLPDLLSALSEAINNLSIRGDSNILASPNRGTYQVVGTDVVAGGALVRVDSITLAPRRSNHILTRELAILSFYLIPDTAPIDSWKANILETSIPSLLYGVVPIYKELHPSGPHSILLELQKGEATKVEGTDKVDTLYLQGTANGSLSYTVSVDGVVHELVLPIHNSNSVIEQVAESLRQVLGTHALVAQLGPQALQVIPNSNTPVTIALSSLPSGLSASTGTSKSPLFPYGAAITLAPSPPNVPVRRPTLAEEASGVYTATSFRMGVSPRMQAVYDRLGKVEALRRKGGLCNGRW